MEFLLGGIAVVLLLYIAVAYARYRRRQPAEKMEPGRPEERGTSYEGPQEGHEGPRKERDGPGPDEF